MPVTRVMLEDDDDRLDDFDPTQTTDRSSIRSTKLFLAELEDEEELGDDYLLPEDNESTTNSPEILISNQKRWKRGVSSRRDRKWDFDRVQDIVQNNPTRLRILSSLYVHRQLDVFQIARIAAPKMHIKALGNLMSEMYAQKVVWREKGAGPENTKGDKKKFYYRLSKSGLELLVEIYLKCDHYAYFYPDLPKEHYLIQNLMIGKQDNHHFETQEFVTRLLQTMNANEIYLPHCEWKRYPLQDPRLEGKKAPYRPDWFLFRPNEHYKTLVDNDRTGDCPLHVPVESRKESHKSLLSDHYKGFVSIECDLKTMDQRLIEDKCRKFLYSLDFYPDNNMAFFSVNGRYARDAVLPIKNTTMMVRLRNTRKVMFKVLKDVMLSDKINVLHGDEHTCRLSLEMFLERDGDFHSVAPRGKEFESYVHALSSTMDTQVAYVTDEVKKMQLARPLPVMPDEAVRITGDWGKKSQTYMVFFVRLGWLNPIAKASAMLEWIEEGEENAKVILVYPNQAEMDEEVHFDNLPFYYVNWEDVVRTGTWGHFKKPEPCRKDDRRLWVWKDVNP
ncbi:hypothetical protein SAMN04487897_10928 [Paenibacillus sp. yr247]|uniref:hypothetical protein n=1 Tax=Paenibacillus sp. yr247 TaxID=1761880 RepID=UPI00087EE962|nr:hypothetical protein [Paenibacillus sp. yr247]SDO15491.1 hypothetical protein SAMN04487897_10928 [Paenibacillus sp. yr247]